MKHRTRRLALAAVLLPLVAVVGAAAWLHMRLGDSLPRLDGEVEIAGLEAPVTVERDRLGVPTIRAANRRDLARATGFVHAQERFFQMDLLRRSSAGELAALFGAQAVAVDGRVRVHRFRSRAERGFDSASAEVRGLLEAYADGVNAGLADLGAAPPEYLALRADPQPWRAEDCLLVLFAMDLTLEDAQATLESQRGVMHDTLPLALVEFLLPPGGFDAPIVGGALPEPPMPGPETIDLHREPTDDAAGGEVGHGLAGAPMARTVPSVDLTAVAGIAWGSGASNAWAVDAGHSADGTALLANDMHLGLGLPNVWYRALLVDGARRLVGVTLPGSPLLVAGSNGHVAWGFTTSYGDFADLVVIDPDPGDPDRYLTPDGSRAFATFDEHIAVRGAADTVLTVRETIWGPIVDVDHLGRSRALRWVVHEPRAADLSFVALETADTVDQALAAVHESGLPGQNVVAADDAGRIGWTLGGLLPRRVGFDGTLPTSWSDGSRRWDGMLMPEEMPEVVDPPAGRIWTANARVGDATMAKAIGDDGAPLGARAAQIRDGLLGIDRATPREMLELQLDDRALFLERWRDLLLRTLGDEATADHPRRIELRDTVRDGWSGHASIDSAGYRLVRAFRLEVAQRTFDPLVAPCSAADPDFEYLRFPRYEVPLWRMLSERPAHLLDSRFADWDALLLAAADGVIEELGAEERPLAERTWGERNRVALRHPLSSVAPWLLGRWLDIPPRPLPGDANMPRVQAPSFGASERLVVAPGHEEDALFHMPGGESGHFLSPNYRAGNDAWAEGRPTPLLPGPTEHRLTLSPAAGGG